MSVVFRAHDEQLDRQVAVKVLHDFLAAEPSARERFHREAMTVAKLKHPAIVEIYDYSGPEAERCYIVTELIEGLTLNEWLTGNGPLAHPELALLMVLPLVEAIEHAHAQGVIHRDIKPENVMVTNDGRLKLMDFGIAHTKDLSRVTATGTVLGSPAHMSPEMIDAKGADERSDIFSIGTILYTLATGIRPFEAPHTTALFRKILEGQYEPPQMVQPRMGNGLARVIDRAMASDPTKRYASAADMQVDLRAELELDPLQPPDEQLRALVRAPDPFTKQKGPELVEALTQQGEAALAARSFAVATDCLNRVLAIAPTDIRLKALMRKLARRRSVGRATRNLAIVAAFGAFSFAAIFVGRLDTRWSSAADATTPRTVPPYSRAQSPGLDASLAFDAQRPANEAANSVPRKKADATVLQDTPPPQTPPRKRPDRRPRTTKAGAQTASNATRVPDAGQQAHPVPLHVRIGNSFADVYINGEKVRGDFYAGTILRLPGEHTVEVVKPGMGRFRARTIIIQSDGTVLERSASGTTTPAPTELLFVVPRPGTTAAPAGWIPAER